MLHKIYSTAPDATRDCYSPAECTRIRRATIEGAPDEKHVSMSYAERRNLTVRRSTRLTNVFRKNLKITTTR